MDDLVQKINDLIESIKGKLDDLLGTVNDFRRWVPWGLGWLADKIKDAWNWLCGKFEEFWTALTDITSHMGDRGALSSTAGTWSSSVGGPVSAQKDAVDASAVLKADDTWVGDAAGAYAGKAKLHQVALEKVVTTYVTAMSSALDTVRAGLVKFYMGLITALGRPRGRHHRGAGLVGDHLRHPRRHLHRGGCGAHRGRRVLHRRRAAQERLQRGQQHAAAEDERQQRVPARGVAERSSGVSVTDPTQSGSAPFTRRTEVRASQPPWSSPWSGVPSR